MSASNDMQPAEQHTPETNDNGSTASSTTSMCFRIPDFHLLEKNKKITKVNLNEDEVRRKKEEERSRQETIRRKKEEERMRFQLEETRSRLERMQKKLTQIEKSVVDLGKFHGSASHKDLQSHLERLQDSVKAFSNSEDFGKKEASTSKNHPAIRLAGIQKEIKNLRKHLSPLEAVSKAAESLSSAHLQSSTGSNGRSAVLELVNVHQSKSFIDSSFFEEIREIFDSLDDKKKFILSSFTVFPENAGVKRRIFVYWGLGEELWNNSVSEDETPENIVDGILKEFQEKGLIEPAIKKRKLHVKSYKMYPLVRSAVTMLSQKADNFDYDGKGNVLPQRYWTSKLLQNPDSGEERVVNKENVSFPRCKRMCLLKDEEKDQEQEQEQKQKQLLEKKPSIPKESQSTSSLNSEGTDVADLGKLVTLFNVNEPFPDLELAWLMKKNVNAEAKAQKKKVIQAQKKKVTNAEAEAEAEAEKEAEAEAEAEEEKVIKAELSAVDWLSKMKDAKVVCLGSWPGSIKSHTEVESIEFLKGLKNSKGLRFLSLQGVSGITEIPKFIGNHSNLLILDLKECHNLEVLSKEIGKLTKLMYLDLSDCYLLARLPKELSALEQLRVLKGFVISNPQRKGSATLDDLKKLKNLRKLSINANSEDFPTDKDLRALQQIEGQGVLRKLTIAWGATLADRQREAQNGGDAGCCQIFKSAPKQHNPKTVTEELSKQLEKLDLQCFPKSIATWLTPDSFPDLKKLYIRGGNLATLDRSKWLKVQALRLKYLRELKMNWRELKDSFPDLEYLEKVKCPGITLCPCDEHGVWMKNPDQIEQK